MNTRSYLIIALILCAATATFAQRGGRPQGGPPGGGPPPEGRMGPGQPGQDRPGQDDWFKRLDRNKDGKIDAAELQASIDTSFTAWDKNGDGTIEASEMPKPPRPPQAPGANGDRPQGPPMEQGMRPGGQGMRPNGPPMGPDKPQGPPEMNEKGRNMLPPFFFVDRNPEGTATSRADFERIVKGVFAEMDKNNDGAISHEEARPPKREGDPKGPPEPGNPPPPPNGKFIAAELRFGDKMVKGQPFSSETVIEDTRRLYDGTTVTKKLSGAFYRDGAGRTRREQPLEMVGGVSIAGTDGKPQMLVFINDFAAHTQYFLDPNNKVARKHGIGGNPPAEPGAPPNAKTESLGTKTIEGVQVEGTRVTFEIPPGQLGNDKAIQVVTENWFSSELQMIVMSRHLDPVAGEHVFRLVNIKRAEPPADLFTVPSGYRIENGGPGKE